MSDVQAIVQELSETADIARFMQLIRKFVEVKAEDLSLEANILDLPLAKVGQSFSKWNLAQVKRYYRIRSLPEEDESHKLQFRVPLPKSIISRMMIVMDDASYSLGNLREGKEIKKVFATFSLFSGLVAQFRKSICLDPEGNLTSDVSQGRCDFVYRTLGDKILHLVEAKRENYDQGLAQLMLMLDVFSRVVHSCRSTSTSLLHDRSPITVGYSATHSEASKEHMLRTFGEIIFGVLYEGWLCALERMNEMQKLDYARPTLSADSLSAEPGNAVPDTRIVDSGVVRARRILEAMRRVDITAERSEQRLDTLFGRLHRLAAAFEDRDIDAMDIESRTELE
ncbi:hypothetical protein DFJ77DRAFT_436491 [Powellomyces hirtus]|nr:hypothetical protein DFJ77DRAFT_436491 [Powellomyces hirtus]